MQIKMIMQTKNHYSRLRTHYNFTLPILQDSNVPTFSKVSIACYSP